MSVTSTIINGYNRTKMILGAGVEDYHAVAAEKGKVAALASAAGVVALGATTLVYAVGQESAMGAGATAGFMAAEHTKPGMGILGAATAGGLISAASEYTLGHTVAATARSMPNTAEALAGDPKKEQSQASKNVNTGSVIAVLGSPGDAIVAVARNNDIAPKEHHRRVNKTATGLAGFGAVAAGAYGLTLTAMPNGVAETITDYAKSPWTWLGLIVGAKTIVSANDSLKRAQERHRLPERYDPFATVSNTINQEPLLPAEEADPAITPLAQAWNRKDARMAQKAADKAKRQALRAERQAKRSPSTAEHEEEQWLNPGRLSEYLEQHPPAKTYFQDTLPFSVTAPAALTPDQLKTRVNESAAQKEQWAALPERPDKKTEPRRQTYMSPELRWTKPETPLSPAALQFLQEALGPNEMLELMSQEQGHELANDLFLAFCANSDKQEIITGTRSGAPLAQRAALQDAMHDYLNGASYEAIAGKYPSLGDADTIGAHLITIPTMLREWDDSKHKLWHQDPVEAELATHTTALPEVWVASYKKTLQRSLIGSLAIPVEGFESAEALRMSPERQQWVDKNAAEATARLEAYKQTDEFRQAATYNGYTTGSEIFIITPDAINHSDPAVRERARALWRMGEYATLVEFAKKDGNRRIDLFAAENPELDIMQLVIRHEPEGPVPSSVLYAATSDKEGLTPTLRSIIEDFGAKDIQGALDAHSLARRQKIAEKIKAKTGKVIDPETIDDPKEIAEMIRQAAVVDVITVAVLDEYKGSKDAVAQFNCILTHGKSIGTRHFVAVLDKSVGDMLSKNGDSFDALHNTPALQFHTNIPGSNLSRVLVASGSRWEESLLEEPDEPDPRKKARIMKQNKNVHDLLWKIDNILRKDTESYRISYVA